VLPLPVPIILLFIAIEVALNVTLAPALLTDGPRIEVSALDGAECNAAVADKRLDWPTSLMVGALVGVGALLELEGGCPIFEAPRVEPPKPSFDGTRLISGCFFSGGGTWTR